MSTIKLGDIDHIPKCTQNPLPLRGLKCKGRHFSFLTWKISTPVGYFTDKMVVNNFVQCSSDGYVLNCSISPPCGITRSLFKSIHLTVTHRFYLHTNLNPTVVCLCLTCLLWGHPPPPISAGTSACLKMPYLCGQEVLQNQEEVWSTGLGLIWYKQWSVL